MMGSRMMMIILYLQTEVGLVIHGKLDLRVAIGAIEDLIKDIEVTRREWIGDPKDFPLNESKMEEVLTGKNGNPVKTSASAVLKWFMKPLKLEYGKGVFPGWDFKVKKSEMRICRRLGLLKNVKEDIVSPSDFIPWAGLQGIGSLANGKAKNLIEGCGIKAWLPFLKFVVEWAFLVVKRKSSTTKETSTKKKTTVVEKLRKKVMSNSDDDFEPKEGQQQKIKEKKRKVEKEVTNVRKIRENVHESRQVEKEKLEIERRLRAFKESQNSKYCFQPHLTSFHRLLVHSIAANLGLISRSQGEGEKRRVTVTKPEEREQSVLFYHGEVNGDDGEGVEDIGEENEEDLNNEIGDGEEDIEEEVIGDDNKKVDDIGEENEEDLNNEIEDSAMESDLEREFEVSYVLKKLLP